MIVSGFKQCGYIEWNGNLDVMHSRLKETITNLAVPLSLILEMEGRMLAREEELLEQPTIDAEQPIIDAEQPTIDAEQPTIDAEQSTIDEEQSTNEEDEEQQDYESDVDLDECPEDTEIAID